MWSRLIFPGKSWDIPPLFSIQGTTCGAEAFCTCFYCPPKRTWVIFFQIKEMGGWHVTIIPFHCHRSWDGLILVEHFRWQTLYSVSTRMQQFFLQNVCLCGPGKCLSCSMLDFYEGAGNKQLTIKWPGEPINWQIDTVVSPWFINSDSRRASTCATFLNAKSYTYSLIQTMFAFQTGQS